MIYPNESIGIYRTLQSNNIISNDTLTVSHNIMMSMDHSSIDPSHHVLPQQQQQLLLFPPRQEQQEQQQSYRDIQTAGLPVNPLEFPTPILHRAYVPSQQSVVLFDTCTSCELHQQARSSRIQSRSGQLQLSNQIDDVSLLCHVNSTNHCAYWIKSPIPSIGRNVHLGIVVVKRRTCRDSDDDDNKDDNNIIMTDDEWVTTNKMVLIKSTSLLTSNHNIQRHNNNNSNNNNSTPLTGT